MIKAGIVCGCLPAQAGIEQPDLYHQLLAKRIFEKYGETVLVSSIWYSTLHESEEKVQELISRDKPDVIIFHVRPDPYLRASKLFIRYHDERNKLKWIINFFADDESIKEKIFEARFTQALRDKSFLKSVGRTLNLALGKTVGANKSAIKKVKLILENIYALCKVNNVAFIMVGPASRPRSKMENYLLVKLEDKLSKYFKNQKFNYVTCIGRYSEQGENLFLADGVHVNKDGHKRIAELLYPEFSKVIAEKS